MLRAKCTVAQSRLRSFHSVASVLGRSADNCGLLPTDGFPSAHTTTLKPTRRAKKILEGQRVKRALFLVFSIFGINYIGKELHEINGFFEVITDLPDRFSASHRAIPATAPPLWATCLFSSKVCGFCSFKISVVVASASIFKTNSKVDMLALKFSFSNL